MLADSFTLVKQTRRGLAGCLQSAGPVTFRLRFMPGASQQHESGVLNPISCGLPFFSLPGSFYISGYRQVLGSLRSKWVS